MPRSVAWGVALLIALTAMSAPPAGADRGVAGRIQLQLDTSEAEAVLAMLDAERAGRSVTEADWQRLFATRPYRRLVQRETSMHRAFSDSAFKAFVAWPPLLARADSLRRTLEAWKARDLTVSAARVLQYLPDSARIRASVYPVIKPAANSFVFEASTDAAIFLYLDPTEGAAKFENTVAHEMHHIGFSSIAGIQDSLFRGLGKPARTAVDWMGAFGEGFAMLAAAGGPDVHPHATSPPADRERWDRDMRNTDRDLREVERFFLDVIDGRLAKDEDIERRAFSFFGIQGPWYTLGYRMAVVVERHDGRAALIGCMVDPRRLLVRYNGVVRAHAAGTEHAAMWSQRLLDAVDAPR